MLRDYIPEKEKPTRAEAARFANVQALIRGGVRADFVPSKGHKRMPPAENGAEAALQVALRAAEHAAQAEFMAAKRRLAQMDVSTAVQFISELPPVIQEVYLVAEELTGNRQDILSAFPRSSDEVRKRYIDGSD